MKKIEIVDVSMLYGDIVQREKLSFKQSLEVTGLLDSLGVSVIEVPPLSEDESDYFLVKAVSSTVNKATVDVHVSLMDSTFDRRTSEALKEAPRSRISLNCPTSPVQMEYFLHKKPDAVLQLIAQRLKDCKGLGSELEFCAGDFTRADEDFLSKAIAVAVDNGADIISIFDFAGDLLPDQLGKAVAGIKATLPEGVRLAVCCSNKLFLADACAVEAVRNGADEILVSCTGNAVSLEHFPHILSVMSASSGASCGIDMPRLDSTVKEILDILNASSKLSSVLAGDPGTGLDIRLSVHDDMNAVLAAAEKLGYELDDEDCRKVYDAFIQLAGSKEWVDAGDLDSIIASVAFQVPATWKLESFVINSGNIMTSTCHVRLVKGNSVLESVSLGDGPIDAAIQAIERVIQTHYELDHFQVRALTEGREALGEAVVRLRSGGKIYSGRGVSTDIVESSIVAYVNAVNKIVYGEGEA